MGTPPRDRGSILLIAPHVHLGPEQRRPSYGRAARPGVDPPGWRLALAATSSCSARRGEERVEGLAELLDSVEDRSTGAAQGGRVAGPGGLGTEQQVAVPVAALVARDVAGQPGPRDILGVPQVYHPRVG